MNMWKRHLSPKKRITLLIGQFVVLVICIGYIEYFYTTRLLPDKRAQAVFNSADCFLVSKKLNTRNYPKHVYRADFLVSYNVNNVQYNRWAFGNGMDRSFSESKGEQEAILARYEVGKTYQCWYDPEDPQLVVLVMRHDWRVTFPLILPAVVAVIMLYYFLTNAVGLMGMMGTVISKRKK
ncbi:DUF3592 domain-containing protein [Aquicella lusitana]|uniref:Uncharacterized protein DUF3592 n=1 Tax=Aquicella lusitana TaxID=254246 RepID=A0A370GES2_9COXI|nr:DUF3592 domain-containing protein [Aquicella lusitana]RDI41706.1 uncharacterized protein DUF3592 [Aquicella lusitana]VVC72682.1 hypothetical protein AQULUS_03960 [Aquicella lusitana]